MNAGSDASSDADGETGAAKDPEVIRQEIEATKDRITDSVEALAEIKADIDYARTHPAEMVKGKVGAEVSRITERVLDAYHKVEEKMDELLGVDTKGSGPA